MVIDEKNLIEQKRTKNLQTFVRTTVCSFYKPGFTLYDDRTRISAVHHRDARKG